MALDEDDDEFVNIEEEITIREDIDWMGFAHEFMDLARDLPHIVGCDMDYGCIFMRFRDGDGQHYVDVHSCQPSVITVSAEDHVLHPHPSYERYVTRVRKLVARLAESYGAWEDRGRTRRG